MGKKVKIMGILNVTPDSFSDGGQFLGLSAAVKRAREMAAAGASIIDIGGEASGPGSVDVPLEEELRRVIPVIKALRKIVIARPLGRSNLDRFASLAMTTPRTNCITISLDTCKAEVARQGIFAGADMINDITALRGDTEMARVIAEAGVPIILMYSKDPTPRTTRIKKRYRDVIKTVSNFFEERIEFAIKQGIKRSQIILDPGMGAFVSGDPKYSFEILRRLRELKKFKLPILVGVSRKSFLPGETALRDVPTFISNLVAAKNGADILRVHNVSLAAKML